MTEVSFATTRDEFDSISKIVARAISAGLVRGPRAPSHWYTTRTMTMDLTACHANGCPLDFDRWLEADHFNFTHDVAGIARHIDRETGHLSDSFLPRFAARQNGRAL